MQNSKWRIQNGGPKVINVESQNVKIFLSVFGVADYEFWCRKCKIQNGESKMVDLKYSYKCRVTKCKNFSKIICMINSNANKKIKVN